MPSSASRVTTAPETATTSPETLADLLDRLGDIPLNRIRMQPPPGTATEEDVIQAEARYNRLCELIDGTLVEKPVGFYESRVATVLIVFLSKYLEEHDLGLVFAPDVMQRVARRQVRMPDVCFYSWDHFPGRKRPPGSILDTSPDLAIEVLSPSNTAKEMARKRREYFRAGTKLVWELDPEKRTVRVYTKPTRSKLVREKGTLRGGDVLPGFKLPLAKLFEAVGLR